MNREEKFNSLMQIAEFNIHQFNQRRDYSWKITISFWGAIIGSVAVIKNTFDTSLDIPLCIVTLVGALVFSLHVYWLYNVFAADKRDKVLAFEARDAAIKLIDVELKYVPALDANRNFLSDWSAIFQFLVTLFLIFSMGWLITLT